jgi:hypothetical protein
VKQFILIVFLALVVARPLAAQTVIKPAPALDSGQIVLRDAVVVLRDSLMTIDGAAGRLQRDYQAASGQALVARARFMRDACARSVSTIPPTRRVLVAAELSGEKKLKRRKELISALDSLKPVLSRCEADFAEMSRPGQGEQVRGYANSRALRVQSALRKYEGVLREFLQVMGIRLLPAGVPRPASAG